MAWRRTPILLAAVLLLALMATGLAGCQPSAEVEEVTDNAPSAAGDWWLAIAHEGGTMQALRFQLREGGVMGVTNYLDEEEVEQYESTWLQTADGATTVGPRGDETTYVLGLDDAGNEVMTSTDGVAVLHRTRDLALQLARAR